MGLFDKILSDVVNGAVDSLTDKIGEKMFKSKQEPIKKEYNEDIDGKECTEIMESENVIPKFDNPEWVQVRNDLIFYDMWEEYIGFNKDIPDKTRIRKFVIWEYGGSLCLLYSDSYILFKLDKFVDKYNINN